MEKPSWDQATCWLDSRDLCKYYKIDYWWYDWKC
jgi:hypothetical protein